MAYGRKEVQDEQMLRYIEQFQDLDEKREGLDFEINDILAELNTVASFEELQHKKVEDIP